MTHLMSQMDAGLEGLPVTAAISTVCIFQKVKTSLFLNMACRLDALICGEKTQCGGRYQ